MRRYIETVFDDIIVGTEQVFTVPDFDQLLASTDRFSLHILTERISGTGVELELELYSSGDGVQWRFRASLGSGLTVDGVGTDSHFVAESGSNLGDCRVRVGLLLSAASGTPQARVRVIACGRDSRPRGLFAEPVKSEYPAGSRIYESVDPLWDDPSALTFGGVHSAYDRQWNAGESDGDSRTISDRGTRNASAEPIGIRDSDGRASRLAIYRSRRPG